MTTPLHVADLTHAIEQHVFRGAISRGEADNIAPSLWVEVGVPALAFEVSEQLARRHVARLGGRTLDALHVASALELKAERFWTFDERQAKLARAEGLTTG